MTELERFQALLRMAVEWLECDRMGTAFIPNDETADKIAVTRTKACAMQLLKQMGKVEL